MSLDHVRLYGSHPLRELDRADQGSYLPALKDLGHQVVICPRCAIASCCVRVGDALAL